MNSALAWQPLEFHDCLTLNIRNGFPRKTLNWFNYLRTPVDASSVVGRKFDFDNLERPRVYPPSPKSIPWCQEIHGRWLPWGFVEIIHQSISKKCDDHREYWSTSGIYRIVELFSPNEIRLASQRELPPGLSFLAAVVARNSLQQ